jgi:hypothetical protein
MLTFLQTLARLLAALLMGIPIGCVLDIVQQALTHPSFRWLLAHHVLLAAPALAGPAALAGIGALIGLGVPGGSDVLRAWMVAAACVIYVWSDRTR